MTSRVASNLLLQRAAVQRLARKVAAKPLQAGFTLIELLIVIIIIGVLAAIAIPSFFNQQNKARVQSANTTVINQARSCAALQVTGEQASFALPADVQSSAPATAPCPSAGNSVVFTSSFDNPPITRQAGAIVSATGSVSMTTCAGASGVTNAVAPECG